MLGHGVILKALAIFAVMIAIAQTAMPVARQTANYDGQKGSPEKRDSGNTAAPSGNPLSLPKETLSNNPRDEAGHSATTNNEGSLSITEYTSMPNEHGLFDFLTLFANIFMAVGAVAAAYIAWRGLPEIARQSRAAADAAVAARESAQAVLNGQRPWIALRIEQPEPGHFRIEGVNVGKTPAQLMSIQGEIVFLRNGEDIPDGYYGGEHVLRLHPRIMVPDVPRTIDEAFSLSVAEQLRDQGIIGHVRLFYIGRVVYMDGTPRIENGRTVQYESRWRYLLAQPEGPALPGFVPPDWEEYT